ncbi:hypothetical protein K461DRAFT_294446 [Myriangium duriaei CBS 260.36]|uniref:Uncharacterized protein n=1 Tax=Myriangium duriaei CBS 260.36 TaxID=1168546 RepID=A0A9P4J5K8_9PEZI|nr:hypothetical protein K461DRAFT_294446 [Myriangium duriaei CBS 260.36]
MKITDYISVPQRDSDEGHDNLRLQRRYAVRLQMMSIAAAFLVVSASLNVLLLFRRNPPPWELLDTLPSRYAHLSRNTTTEFFLHTAHASTNRTIQEAAWNEAEIDPWTGIVALDQGYVKDLNLLPSQKWPWDSTKGVYVLNSFHELHCVHTLREGINQYHDGIPQEDRIWSYGHLMHCINLMRQAVMCNADDTPLYIGRINQNANTTSTDAGVGVPRKCRDWNALNGWSRSHSACYRGVNWDDEEFPETERYKFCPDGTQPWL